MLLQACHRYLPIFFSRGDAYVRSDALWGLKHVGLRPGNPSPASCEARWTGVLQASLGPGYRIIEEGLSSRAVAGEDDLEGDKMGKRHLVVCLESQAPLDLVVIMLGANDLKHRFLARPFNIGAAAGVLLDIVARSTAGRNGAPPQALLIAPPMTRLTAFADMFAGSVEKSRAFAPLFAEAPKLRGFPFLDAGTAVRCSDLDGIHFEACEYRKLGEAVARELKRLLPICISAAVGSAYRRDQPLDAFHADSQRRVGGAAGARGGGCLAHRRGRDRAAAPGNGRRSVRAVLAENAPAGPRAERVKMGFGQKKAWQRPTLPPSSGSTIGAAGLNFRVRDGNGWVPCAIVTRQYSLEGTGTGRAGTIPQAALM